MTNLWVTPSELGSTYSTSEYADDACKTASNILWTMSGRKYSGTVTTTERYFTSMDAYRYGGLSAKNFFPNIVHGEIYNIPSEDWQDSAFESDGSSTFSRIRLRGKPVREVHLVRSLYTGDIVSNDSYYVGDHSTIVAYQGTPWPPGHVEVTYTYGAMPPIAGRKAAMILAVELIKLWSGDDCALPDRVTSISRQGVSYTILDNQDFLENFRTGIYAIDLFLKMANPAKALAPSKVFSPDIPRARRPAPARPKLLTASSTYDVALTKTNSWADTKVIACTGSLSTLTNYNTSAWSLRLTANSYSGSYSNNFSSAYFSVVSGTTYLNLSFDYGTTFRTIGPNDPGTWTLYAVQNSTGATTELLEGNLQILKVTQGQIDPLSADTGTPTKLVCKQGETFNRTVTWSIDGVPVSLTGYTAAMQVRTDYTSTSAILSLTSSPAAGLTLGGAAGTIAISVSAITTTGLTSGSYVYDLELTSPSPSSEVTRLLEGQFIVTPQVTLI
jgi:hypothetical protein